MIETNKINHNIIKFKNEDPNQLNLAGFAPIHGVAEHCPRENASAILVLLNAKNADFDIKTTVRLTKYNFSPLMI